MKPSYAPLPPSGVFQTYPAFAERTVNGELRLLSLRAFYCRGVGDPQASSLQQAQAYYTILVEAVAEVLPVNDLQVPDSCGLVLTQGERDAIEENILEDDMQITRTATKE